MNLQQQSDDAPFLSAIVSTPIAEQRTVQLFSDASPIVLESGEALAPVHVHFETYGKLNTAGSNAILICHALTANAHAGGPDGWWEPLIGPDRPFDTNRYFVICPNIFGSCYGTTGPTSINPQTGVPYRMTFPQFTIRDIVHVQKAVLDYIGVKSLAAVCGSSLGGMQVLEWPLMFPDFCRSIIPISTAAQQTAWCIALNTAARSAILSDPVWKDGNYLDQPANGLALARMIGMISYRSPAELEHRFGRARTQPEGSLFEAENSWSVESYLRHQGQKLVQRFDANTYLYLSRAMDLHDVARGRGELKAVLETIDCAVCCIGFTSDQRYPVSDQLHIVQDIPRAELRIIDSIHGHDAFLIEFEKLGDVISKFLERS